MTPDSQRDPVRTSPREAGADRPAHEARRQAEETSIALAAANAELDAFSYAVAHDLRSPLRGLQGFSQALLEDHHASLDEKGQDYLRRIAAAAQRMSGMLDDLLTLSRMSRAPIAPSAVDLSAMAREVAGTLERVSQRRVDVTIADGLTAYADPQLLRVVFDHLLGNAWKFTGPVAEPHIDVGTTSVDGTPAFFVRDNGVGFDEAYASKLFAPFQRLHSDKEFAGAGIGLATVQRIVRRHGGRVWAAAAVNRGATIYFTLPGA